MESYKVITASRELLQLHMKDILELEQNSGLDVLWNTENYFFDLELKWDLSKLLFFNEKLIGIVIISKKSPLNVHIHRFIISDLFRKKGVGTFFLNKIKRENFKGYNSITLFVGKDNVQAKKFYERNSFFILLQVEENDLFMLPLLHQGS